MKRKLRWVVDTNILMSALLWRGMPGRVIELAGAIEVQLFSSRILLDELNATLNKKRLIKPVLATGRGAAQMLLDYQRLATLVTARQLERPISRDADDDAVLACAMAARAALIVTGDEDLLVLKTFNGIPIVTARYAVERLNQDESTTRKT